MTAPLDADVLQALRFCTFLPASFDKRFVRDVNAQLDAGKPLTEKQVAVVQMLGHRYRRQLGRCLARACEKCRATRETIQAIDAGDEE